jgi:GT2 family glycosyltransferase
LLLQHGENNFEVIVVDDASSDGSFEFLSGIEGLRLLRMPSQSGYVLASNKGAELARTDMLVFLNNDTIVQADWLDGLLQVFEQFPDTGIVGAKLLYPNGRLQEAVGAIFNNGSVWNIGRFEHEDNQTFNYVREVGYVSNATGTACGDSPALCPVVRVVGPWVASTCCGFTFCNTGLPYPTRG